MSAITRAGFRGKITALYGRLSDDDGAYNESNSITNQRMILFDYAQKHGYPSPQFFYDDGVSGTTFERPGFKEMESLIEAGNVSTVIVKDLSRFGRNYLEVGNYLEVVYPTLGVKFIAIQENIDTITGSGTEMMPFHNIFNEWYAAQTSKKIKAVWAIKSAHGERINQTVPYGYVKDPENHEKWDIDEPAAEVVRKIYNLFLSGRGPSQIANQLTDERILCPTAYKINAGRPGNHLPPGDPYSWETKTVVSILENQKYTGCTVNFKRTNVSYKVHKVVLRPKNEWQVIPNTQEPIIDEDTWQRAQELRSTRRRRTASGRTSMFSGLIFCADCGAKLHFCASKNLKPSEEFFRCANYKSKRGCCTAHCIRNVVIERIVLEAISGLAEFVRCYEPAFLYMIEQKQVILQKQKIHTAETTLEQSKKRLLDIERIISTLYEDRVFGKITDDRFAKLSATYETEQQTLEDTIAECEEKIKTVGETKLNIRSLIQGLREFTEIGELDQTLVNKLIRRIEVHDKEVVNGRKCHRIDIYYTAVGMIDPPTQQELEKINSIIQESTIGNKRKTCSQQ